LPVYPGRLQTPDPDFCGLEMFGAAALNEAWLQLISIPSVILSYRQKQKR